LPNRLQILGSCFWHIPPRGDVVVHLPGWMDVTCEKFDESPELLESELPGTDYNIQRLIDTDEREEAVLVDEADEALVVMETLGPFRGTVRATTTSASTQLSTRRRRASPTTAQSES